MPSPLPVLLVQCHHVVALRCEPQLVQPASKESILLDWCDFEHQMPTTEELNTTAMTTARPASDFRFFSLSLSLYPSLFCIKINLQNCSSHGHRRSTLKRLTRSQNLTLILQILVEKCQRENQEANQFG